MLTVTRRAAAWNPLAQHPQHDFILHGVLALLVQSWPEYFHQPVRNKNVDQTKLRTFLEDGLLPELVAEHRKRMDSFVAAEIAKGHRPLVMVAGRTANAAFQMFQLSAPIVTEISL
jgi:hypothetical protein